MALPEKLRKKLACPKCRQPLVYRESESRLECDSCLVGFRITDGVPILLVDEAEKLK